MIQELSARRAFDNDVGAFLKAVGLTEDFEKFRETVRAARERHCRPLEELMVPLAAETPVDPEIA